MSFFNEINDFFTAYFEIILVVSIIIVIAGLISAVCIYNSNIEKQPSKVVAMVMTSKLYKPPTQHVHSTYNSSTKTNDVFTTYDSESYEVNLLMLDSNEVISKDDKDIFVRYNPGDTLDVTIKEWKGNIRIKHATKHGNQF